jgi:hypothetical protein
MLPQTKELTTYFGDLLYSFTNDLLFESRTVFRINFAGV